MGDVRKDAGPWKGQTEADEKESAAFCLVLSVLPAMQRRPPQTRTSTPNKQFSYQALKSSATSASKPKSFQNIPAASKMIFRHLFSECCEGCDTTLSSPNFSQ